MESLHGHTGHTQGRKKIIERTIMSRILLLHSTDGYILPCAHINQHHETDTLLVLPKQVTTWWSGLIDTDGVLYVLHLCRSCLVLVTTEAHPNTDTYITSMYAQGTAKNTFVEEEQFFNHCSSSTHSDVSRELATACSVKLSQLSWTGFFL